MSARSAMRGAAFMGTVYRIAAALATIGLVSGCGSGRDDERTRSVASPPAPRNVVDAPKVVFLGDSLTAGLGLSEDVAFPAIVGRLLAADGRPITVVNAGVSGDTSAGGLRRLPWVLRQTPDVLVVGLGANDALRGQPVEETEASLREIIRDARASGTDVLLLGMRIPTNYGPDYAEAFAAIYPRLSREEGVALVPFLLEGVAGRIEMNLPDGIHPNAKGHGIVAATVAPAVERLLRGRVARSRYDAAVGAGPGPPAEGP